MSGSILKLTGNNLSIEDIYSFILDNRRVQIDKEAAKRINKSRALVEKWVNEEKVIYGVTTGFGEFSNVSISKKDIEQLQENLIVSHAVGCGEPLPPFIVKIMMLLRVNALAKGYSGIRLSTMQTLVEMINQNIIPVIPSQGSVGSSGDLVQLSHLVLALIGMGRVYHFKKSLFDEKELGKIFEAKSVFKKIGLIPVRLKAKEGLALINGTQMMTSFAAHITARAKRLNKVADIAASLSHEALRATDRAFDERVHNLRAYEGQSKTAKNILAMIRGSEIRDSHRNGDPRVQDAYSIRCIPQIHGASRDAIEYVNSRVSIEINSANDNPLIFADTEEHLEGGNFHGQPMALAMDFMGIALAELANVSERRIERMVNGALNQGLPRFLTSKGGLNSGMMIAQYTAASLVSENKVLAHPASVDSIPTSANQEDHNSMGSIAAQKCYKILNNLENVLAIELMTAAQGLEFLKPLKPGIGTAKAYQKIREVVKPLNEDRILHYDLMKILKLVKEDSLLNAVEHVVKLY
jgi:histidine ammonia-lyase